MIDGGNPKQQWRLLYRSSRDGWSAKAFHRLCDDKGATITIARVRGGGPLVGGYTQVSWTSRAGDYFLRDDTAFLFNTRADAATIAKFPIKLD